MTKKRDTTKPLTAAEKAVKNVAISGQPKPWGSLHSTHSGVEADWCRNCRDER